MTLKERRDEERDERESERRFVCDVMQREAMVNYTHSIANSLVCLYAYTYLVHFSSLSVSLTHLFVEIIQKMCKKMSEQEVLQMYSNYYSP